MDESNEIENTDSDTYDEDYWSTFFVGFTGIGAVTAETTPMASTSRPCDRPLPPLNAFYSRVTSVRYYDNIRMILMTPVAAVRAVFMSIFVLLAWTCAIIGTCRLNEVDSEKQLSWWRRGLRTFSKFFIRQYFTAAGFWWVSVIGKQASPKQAPILVGAPHSSFWDALVICSMAQPSVVAKIQTKDVLIFGTITTFMQPVYVHRENEVSRRESAQKIVKRARLIQAGEDVPQLFIFSEGTCSNRSCLIKYRPGAFLAGVPVQPVLIRYPNNFDCMTWTFDSPKVFYSLWLSMLQFRNYLEIEFLPPYNPSESEKKDATLYGNNIRRLMADALGVPTKEWGFEDGILMEKLSRSSLRKRIKAIAKARKYLSIKGNREESFITENKSRNNIQWMVTPQLFLQHMQVETADAVRSPVIKELFAVFKNGNNSAANEIDLREYMFLVFLSQPNIEDEKFYSIFFSMYSQDRSTISKDTFISLMERLFETKPTDAEELFKQGDATSTTINLTLFTSKLSKRVDFTKLYAMEEASGISLNYPPANIRAELSHKTKVD